MAANSVRSYTGSQGTMERDSCAVVEETLDEFEEITERTGNVALGSLAFTVFSCFLLTIENIPFETRCTLLGVGVGMSIGTGGAYLALKRVWTGHANEMVPFNVTHFHNE